VASRRDLIQSYQFLTRRVVAAFVTRDADPEQSPLRKGVGALYAGIMVAILVGAGFGVYGLLTHTGNTSWQVDGTVVVEQETGAVFVYGNGELHPMLNLTSALLVAHRSPPTMVTVPAKELAGVPRTISVGIPYAPTSLPPASQALRGAWAMCSGSDATVMLSVGVVDRGGTMVDRNHALLVNDGSRNYFENGAYHYFLVWRGVRYPLTDSKATDSLYQVQPISAVGPAWLKSLQIGQTIGPIYVPDKDTTSPTVPGRRVGDIVYATLGSGERQNYLVYSDGVLPITPLELAVTMGESATAPVEAEITLSQANSLPRTAKGPKSSTNPPAPDSAPPLVPRDSGQEVCAHITDARTAPEVWVGGSVAAMGAGIQVMGGGVGSSPMADRVAVPAGRFAITVDPSGTNYSIVTDTGVRYPVSDPSVLGYLGYSADLAVSLPNIVLSRLPVGPSLDPNAAGDLAQ
jgi:type VII secretion protein EccB